MNNAFFAVPALTRFGAQLSVWVILVVLVSVGCSSDHSSSENAQPSTDENGVPIVFSDMTSEKACGFVSEPSLSIGVTEGEDPYQFYRIMGAARLSDGRIVIVNQGSQEIRFFDQKGIFQYASGSEGEGPGEFQRAFYLWVLPGDSIWVGDYRPWEFEIFGPDGTWVRRVEPTPELINTPDGFAVLDDGQAILGRQDPFNRETNWAIRNRTIGRYSTSGMLSDTLAVLEDGRWGRIGEDGSWMFPLFESFAEFDARGSLVAYGHGSEASFVVLDSEKDFEATMRVSWNSDGRTVTSDDVDRAHDGIRARNANVPEDMFRRFVEPMMSDERPIADVKAAYTELLVSHDDAFWVRTYVGDDDNPWQTWIHFDSEGHYACTATLPHDAMVQEFGSDYALAVSRAEFGSETVELYEISQ